MQPYQEATEQTKKRSELPAKALKLAGQAAATVATGYYGGLAINKALPFLSKYIPESIAVAGLNKLDKRFGKFFKKAQEKGTPFEEAREFIKEKITPEEKRIETLGKFNKKIKQPSMMAQEEERFLNQYGAKPNTPQPQQQMQQQPQQGSGDAAIIAALEKILSM